MTKIKKTIVNVCTRCGVEHPKCCMCGEYIIDENKEIECHINAGDHLCNACIKDSDK